MKATTLKKIRRMCLNQYHKNCSCRGCVLFAAEGCKIKKLPLLWDLREIWRLLNKNKKPAGLR
jgi:hypothetical protein